MTEILAKHLGLFASDSTTWNHALWLAILYALKGETEMFHWQNCFKNSVPLQREHFAHKFFSLFSNLIFLFQAILDATKMVHHVISYRDYIITM